ncbi:MAG: LytR C-terminal domain-containing protein [Candidatus Aquicultor sp.]
MDDFFKPLEEGTERSSRLELLGEAKSERRRRLAIIFTSVVVVLAVAVGGFFVFRALAGKKSAQSERAAKHQNTVETKRGEDKKQQLAQEDQKQESTDTAAQVKQVANVLIVGVQEQNGRKQARGILFAKIDLLSGTIQGVNIPEKTYLNITGLGLDQIGASFALGMNATKKVVEDLLHVPADSYITMHYEDFEYLISENTFQTAFDKAVETNLFEGEKKEYSKQVARIMPAKINIVPLPVKFVSINGEPYYQPNNEEVSRLLTALWGIKVEVKTDNARVIILNGAGLPGAGRVISDKLTPNGFMVIDIKNASSFNYKKTEIVAYKEDYMEKAKQIQQLLGIGNVVYHPVSQDVAEIAIIIGHDFKLTSSTTNSTAN